jgi:coproporphyrinogen III oxidase
MSGGTYDYAYGRIRDLADAIEGDLTNSRLIPCSDAVAFAVDVLRLASEIGHDVEWFASGDTSAEQLETQATDWHRRLHEALKKFEEQKCQQQNQ